jgi:type IX secretion system PorP/SprF family membrane protein
MKRKVLLYVLLLTGIVSYAQEDAQFTQYMYNTINVNPAYAGSRGVLSVFALHRTQWVGLDGAPVTNAVSINTPLKGTRLGLGVSIINDKIGPIHENTISTDLSYTIPTSEMVKISFGIKATANLFDLDYSRLNPVNDDPTLNDYNNKFSPNIGAGVYLHSDKAYVGVSVPNFIETNRYDDNEVAVFKEKVNFYLIAGYIFDFNKYIKFKPALLTKIVKGAPLKVDVSGNFMFNEKFVVGLAYRLGAAVTALAGFQVTEGLYVGYGYDLETTNLSNYSTGSHEVFLRYDLVKKNKKMTTQRFF